MGIYNGREDGWGNGRGEKGGKSPDLLVEVEASFLHGGSWGGCKPGCRDKSEESEAGVCVKGRTSTDSLGATIQKEVNFFFGKQFPFFLISSLSKEDTEAHSPIGTACCSSRGSTGRP